LLTRTKKKKLEGKKWKMIVVIIAWENRVTREGEERKGERKLRATKKSTSTNGNNGNKGMPLRRTIKLMRREASMGVSSGPA
jgi:hypothetical protein